MESPSKTPFVRDAFLAGATYFIAIFLVFGCWVHYYYAGNYSGPLWISTLFGNSHESYLAGARPVYREPIAGWDGQFYYSQSNDPFALRILDHPTLIDSPSYRYQRNGLPLMAWLASRMMGQQYTSPFVYFLVEFGVTSTAFGLLFAFLKSHSIHPAWALVWGFYGGVIRPMIHGLPDATADSLLLICILSALGGKLWRYMFAASMLCLCRESYAAPAFVVWALTCLNRFNWGTRAYLARVGATTTPGIVVLGWAFYIAHATNSSVLSGSRSIPWGGLVDWPFFAYFRCNYQSILAGSLEKSFFYSTSCALVLAVVFGIVVRRVKTHVAAAAMLAHILLMTMTGWIVWEAGVGYFKNTASVVMVGVMLLPFSNSKLLRFALLFSFVLSVHYLYRSDFHRMIFLPPIEDVRRIDEVAKEPAKKDLEVHPRPNSVVAMPKPCEHASKVVLIDTTDGEDNYRGIFRPFHRFPKTVFVRVTNMSTQLWAASLPGDGAVSLAYQVLNDRRRVLQEDRLVLYENVEPGESIDIEFRIPSGSWLAGKQTVRVALIQDGDAWFDHNDPSQGLKFEN